LGEIFANHISDKKLMSETYKELDQLYRNKQEPEETFLRRRYTIANRCMKKMFNITNH
jgi:hypothetical protein